MEATATTTNLKIIVSDIKIVTISPLRNLGIILCSIFYDFSCFSFIATQVVYFHQVAHKE